MGGGTSLGYSCFPTARGDVDGGELLLATLAFQQREEM